MNNYNAKLMPDNRLRVTVAQGDYIYLKLKTGKYQDKYLDMVRRGEVKLGIMVITPEYCVFPVSKDTEPYTPEGLLSIDLNEKSIDGLVVKDDRVELHTWDLRKVFECASNAFDRYRRFQKRYPKQFRLHRRIATKWFTKRNNRVDWYLHNVLNEILELAEKEKLKVVMEELKNKGTWVNKKVLKTNKYNGKLQWHRKLPKKILGRLNRWMARWIQFIMQYKSDWSSIPTEYVNPYGTSSRCSRCGEKLNSSNWHSVSCPSCNLSGNRHQVACINIAMKSEDEGMRFVPDWQAMTRSLSVG